MKNDNKSAGQAVVELALMLPLLLLLLVGILDFGRAFYSKIALTNAAREGAYYLSYHSSELVGGACAATTKTVQAVVAEAYSAGLNVSAANVACGTCPGDATCVQVTVSETIDMLILDFLTGPYPLQSTARMRVQQ